MEGGSRWSQGWGWERRGFIIVIGRGSALRKASTRISGHLTRTAQSIDHFSIVSHRYSSQAPLQLLTFPMERYHLVESKTFLYSPTSDQNSFQSEPPKSPSPRSRIFCRSWPKHPSSSAWRHTNLAEQLYRTSASHFIEKSKTIFPLRVREKERPLLIFSLPC